MALGPLEIGEVKTNTLKLRRTRQAWYVLTVPFHVVPGYDVEAARREMDDESFRREIMLDWTASGNKAIYTQYREQTHVALEPLTFYPQRELHVGWDPAYTGTPAFAITQINPMGQWQIFPSVCPPPDVSVGPYEFGCMVADHLQREYATPFGMDLFDLKMVHIGDPWGRARVPRPGQSKKEAASFYDILRHGIDVIVGDDEDGRPIYEHRPGWGWRVIPGAVNITDRLEAVRSRLSLILPGGYPGVVIDPRAQLVIRGFGGEYAYKDYGDGNYSREPNKNYVSNIMDAIGYVATKLFAKYKPVKERDEDDDDGPVHEFRSMASSRYE